MKLERSTTGPKDWWKTLKHFIKPDQQSTIPSSNKDEVIHSDDMDKDNVMNEYFTAQTVLGEIKECLPQPNSNVTYILDSLTFIPDEVEQPLTLRKHAIYSNISRL